RNVTGVQTCALPISTLQIGAGVHAGGGVPLEEDVVAASRVVLATEEVVVAHFVQRRRPGIGGDVSADPDARALRAVHHDRRVPPDPPPVGPPDGLVTGELRLELGGD